VRGHAGVGQGCVRSGHDLDQGAGGQHVCVSQHRARVAPSRAGERTGLSHAGEHRDQSGMCPGR
jgi:hypothetical protein